MTQLLRCLVSWEANTQKPEDLVVNTFHFTVESSPPSATTLAAIETQLVTLFQGMQSYVSNEAHTGAWSIKWYNLADPRPRVPIRTVSPASLTFTAGASLPPEVSLCVSFKGIPIAGIPMARRRGRIYTLPFKSSATAGLGYFSSSVLTAWKGFWNNFLNASNAATDWKWVIYSPTSESVATVAAGWLDNAPDIQRRRGRGATLRYTFP